MVQPIQTVCDSIQLNDKLVLKCGVVYSEQIKTYLVLIWDLLSYVTSGTRKRLE